MHKRVSSPVRKSLAIAAAAALVLLTAAPATAKHPTHHDGNPLQPGAHLFVNPRSTTVEAMHHLRGEARKDAALLARYPSATWFTDGSPRRVQVEVAAVVKAAAKRHSVPVIVAYYLPNRDCGQYSAGGAQSTAQYQAWIDGVARGIGNRPAAVILEPDGLGLIPNYVSRIDGSSNCSIDGVDPANRFVELNYAVDRLKAGNRTAVYLDATHTGWQNVGESAQRLLTAGVQRADGFFLNASNYQFTTNLQAYGRWVSSCIALAERDSAADPTSYDFGGSCGNQYWNGGPATNWTGAGMNLFAEWTSTPWADPANPTAEELAGLPTTTAGVDSRYASMLGATVPTTHFVIDTSRNGQGPWAGGGYPDNQDWCNPPDRGLGIPPTTTTGDPLADAFLWIKVPGESDGQCGRGLGTGTDPEWGGITDPAAGAWFPAQAAQLIDLPNPPLA